jgi:hypothetical protein
MFDSQGLFNHFCLPTFVVFTDAHNLLNHSVFSSWNYSEELRSSLWSLLNSKQKPTRSEKLVKHKLVYVVHDEGVRLCL